jgi:hypothetical protein
MTYEVKTAFVTNYLSLKDREKDKIVVISKSSRSGICEDEHTRQGTKYRRGHSAGPGPQPKPTNDFYAEDAEDGRRGTRRTDDDRREEEKLFQERHTGKRPRGKGKRIFLLSALCVVLRVLRG